MCPSDIILFDWYFPVSFLLGVSIELGNTFTTLAKKIMSLIYLWPGLANRCFLNGTCSEWLNCLNLS